MYPYAAIQRDIGRCAGCDAALGDLSSLCSRPAVFGVTKNSGYAGRFENRATLDNMTWNFSVK